MDVKQKEKEFFEAHPTAQLKSHVTPSGTMTIKDVDNTLQEWEELDGFCADVVFLDYMELLKAIDGREQPRDQINTTWLGTRSLAHKRHCLICSATQSDGDALGAETQEYHNYSGDVRKYAHATSVFALTKSAWMEALGVLKVAPLLARKNKKLDGVILLQALAQDHPHIDSYFTHWGDKRYSDWYNAGNGQDEKGFGKKVSKHT
jgi:hypothetical protein